jgi:Tfp pilus assembly protein PilX
MKEQEMKSAMRRHPRGAALMAALLMTLVLSGVGLVVMQSTMQSMKMSGNYKMRKQANAGAEAAVLYTSNMVGDQASTFWRGMESATQTATSNGGDFVANQAIIGRGGAMIVSNADQPSATVPVMKVFQGAVTNGETGLFTDTAGNARSFEQKTASGNATGNNTFRVVLRDPVEGPPAPGYSGRFCFKKIYFASATQYGALNGAEATDWTKPPLTIATARNGMEGFIGPIECGAR